MALDESTTESLLNCVSAKRYLMVLAVFPWASAHSEELESPVISSLASLGKLAAALVFVIFLFVVFAKLMKRIQLGHKGAHSGLNIVSALPLGQRERIVVVQVGDEQLLLGVTSTQINTLHVLEKPLTKPLEKIESPLSKNP